MITNERTKDAIDDWMAVKDGKKSHWHQFFSTPEKTARTLALMCDLSPECSFCLLSGRAKNICGNGDYDALLEWLRSDAE